MDTPNFIKYLSSLSPAGETALFVQQKIKGKRLEIYADGVVKSTWIPYLPEDVDKIKGEWAVYGNTASFIKDRLKEKVSASSANCEYVLVMVLDDIGTKSKTPPIKPTWIMETSEGSFQWGYTFSEQPTKGEFAATIRAIADAGYTDPGACNAVRNFRLPGSVNLKPNKGKFKSRLVEFNPDREFTLNEICAALDVIPGAHEADSRTPTHIKRTDDPVLKWLSDKNLVLSRPNHAGWASIVCPNHGAHSVAEDVAARYNTNDRGFVCYHEHCQHMDSQSFLEWVRKEGGPKAHFGVDAQDVANTLVPALKSLPNSQKEIEDVKKKTADIEEKQILREEKEDLFARFAYVTSDDSYFDMVERKEYSRGTFNALFRHLDCKSMHNNRRLEASTYFDENRNSMGGRVIAGLTYAPGEEALLMQQNELLGNRWIDARPKVESKNGDVTMWLEHGKKLIQNEKEFNHVLDVMAYRLQHPDRKVNHAVLHAGPEGCGKDTFWAPFIWGVCGPYYRNRGYLDGVTLTTQWGYHLESEILLINELRESTQAERLALANNLKPIIAAPPEFLEINRKNKPPYKAINRTFVLAFSNSKSPISLPAHDRRWFVVWSQSPHMLESDARRIWEWYNNGGLEDVTAWLYKRDVSNFNPSAIPPLTDAKIAMIDDSMSMVQAYISHHVREESGEFQSGVVGSPLYRLADRLQGQAPTGTKIHHAAITEALQDADWVDLGMLKSRQHMNMKRVWVSPRIHKRLLSNDITRSDLRNMIEQAPATNLKVT